MREDGETGGAQRPRPYTVRPPLGPRRYETGGEVCFGLSLFGRAAELFPLDDKSWSDRRVIAQPRRSAAMDELLFEVTDLKQWTYCPRVVYYRYCLPEIRPVTRLMTAGIASHGDEAGREERRSLRAYGLAQGERAFDVGMIAY